jgi:hypothetical protein
MWGGCWSQKGDFGEQEESQKEIQWSRVSGTGESFKK